jgi:hypothetical protein
LLALEDRLLLTLVAPLRQTRDEGIHTGRHRKKREGECQRLRQHVALSF